MTIIAYDASRLPPEVRPYALGENVSAPTVAHYGREVVHLAVQLRRITLRKFTIEYPGLQWHKYYDYHRIMGQEIQKFAENVLGKKNHLANNDAWNKLCDACPRVAYLFAASSRGLDLSRRGVVQNLRYHIWKTAIQDPRTLGEIEEYILGEVRFGIPTRSNHPRETNGDLLGRRFYMLHFLYGLF